MKVKKEHIAADPGHGQALMATGGLLGALATSSCCVLRVLLFSLGVSGAWIGYFTRLAPYQPYFLAATLLFLGTGYWIELPTPSPAAGARASTAAA
ncbi:mercuric transporter MerT family protein [Bradyrhizobium archetypum]|uniref:Mercuric transport protein MerT n=1 Tax=Bradyrhizobium archetypum TaxID=2721160 RepID=A0A7Y4H9L5_9BRAD|nr:mercuric transporter MerT family protein [Bradyrhizobium archetypum]NOJ49849.1 hypothetical protein [Bradyrhizobium archetypum]